VPSFLVVFFYSYIFERTKEKIFNIVHSKNEELSKTINKLEKHEEELGILHDELESRVADRTSELNDANKKLLEEVKLKNRAKKRAESASKMKTEFLAQMSHEIRTPINSILSYSQLLKEETLDKIPEELRFSFDMINNGGRRLVRTMDLILNMSEIQTGTYEPLLEYRNIITDILIPLTNEFQSIAKSKQLTLKLTNNIDGNHTSWNMDVYTVTQIFVNLIDNAIKYTNSGSIEVIAYKNEKFEICVDVKDTGIGISKKFQRRIFEPFTQEEQGYTRKFEGNGLGMALVKEYCIMNDINISVQSKKGDGSVFTLEFQNGKNENITKQGFRRD
jgi:signal transduction histidine kinase